ncbi:hypothetical protein FLL45_02560 [Aliikangiella marina]|uniref:Uncharacterized protein n=1 Tax=Aliikangiella marina TaxID=1712262 RepID=A0A545TI03_9GAMM|nr:hypothetical protein [Aliikangiella marina]TQV76857.1 hypothetical protein FLL45_02560 [Aliikangiella marina]
MGAYTKIKGWIEVPESLGKEIEPILIKYITSEYLNKHQVKVHQADLYSGGWVIQESPINGYKHVFFGAETRTYLLGYIKAQIEEIALLVEKTDDFELYPEGFFSLEEDGTHSYPDVRWIVSHGRVRVLEGKLY